MSARGQALTEMLAVLLGIVPLWLALLAIAGLQDLAITTQAAARYAAFDHALAPEAAGTTALRVRRYLFDTVPGPVFATSDARDWSAYPGLWIDPATRARWLDSPTQVSLATGASRLGGLAGSASDAALALVAPSAPLAPGRFGIRSGGPSQARVRAELRDVHLPLLPRPFVLSAGVSVLGDSWGADDSRQTASRTGGLSPLRVLSPVTALIRPLTPLLVLFEPRLREFCPAVVAPDIVPADRTVPRVSAAIREYPRC